MVSIQIAMWRMTIAVMFIIFIVVVVFPIFTFVLARFGVDKGRNSSARSLVRSSTVIPFTRMIY
jgi:heme/copper-type cytochrome/quinol oxidase subunit 2